MKTIEQLQELLSVAEIDKVAHKCEMAERHDSVLRSQSCRYQFLCCADGPCQSEKYCPPRKEKMMPIFLDPDDFSPGPLRMVPRVLNEDGSVQHVYCDGARFHVLSWSTEGRHCSEPECEVNREREVKGGVGDE